MGDVSPFFTPTLLSVILTEKVSSRLVLYRFFMQGRRKAGGVRGDYLGRNIMERFDG
jgi:hypothetical protein